MSEINSIKSKLKEIIKKSADEEKEYCEIIYNKPFGLDIDYAHYYSGMHYGRQRVAEEILKMLDKEKSTSSSPMKEILSKPPGERIYCTGCTLGPRKETIKQFCDEVERRAEEKMLKTGKLEGAHCAAMKELQSEICD